METRGRANRSRAPGSTSPEDWLFRVDSGLDRRLEEGLQQFLQIAPQRFGIAAAEGETIALHGGEERVQCREFHGPRSRLAQFRPGADHLPAVLDAVNDHVKAL